MTNEQTTDTTLSNSDVRNDVNNIDNGPTLGEATCLEQDKNNDKEVTEALGNTGTKGLGTTLRRSQSEDNIQKENPFFNLSLNRALVCRTPRSSRQGAPRLESVENTEKRFPPTDIFHWPQYSIGHHVAQKALRLPINIIIRKNRTIKRVTLNRSVFT